MARVIQVIETEVYRGTGSVNDPKYCATQYWSMNGQLIYETPRPNVETDHEKAINPVIRTEIEQRFNYRGNQ